MTEREATQPVAGAVAPCVTAATFMAPDHVVLSAWLEHAPFAFWIAEASAPASFVELGTHNGFSFFAVCQAVKTLGLSTACFAVDTWQGDDHAGHYGDEIYAEVSAVQQTRYADIATLVRSTFDEALPYFADSSVDLLHIDGRHGYEDVKHDFESWLPKLSSSSVVLFHDINVRRDGFGVWRFWEELKQRYPHFEFTHGHGLGVIGVGTSLSASVAALFAASADARTTAVIRRAYGRLGNAVSETYLKNEAGRNLQRCMQEQATKAAQVEQVLAQEAAQQSALAQARTEARVAQEAQRLMQEAGFASGQQDAAHRAALTQAQGELRTAQEALQQLQAVASAAAEQATAQKTALEQARLELRAAQDALASANLVMLDGTEEHEAALVAQATEFQRERVRLEAMHQQTDRAFVEVRSNFEKQRVAMTQLRQLAERQAREKSLWKEQIGTRHPMTRWMDDWSRRHPRRANWVWAVMRACNMLITLQWGRLAAGALRRIR